MAPLSVLRPFQPQSVCPSLLIATPLDIRLSEVALWTIPERAPPSDGVLSVVGVSVKSIPVVIPNTPTQLLHHDMSVLRLRINTYPRQVAQSTTKGSTIAADSAYYVTPSCRHDPSKTTTRRQRITALLSSPCRNHDPSLNAHRDMRTTVRYTGHRDPSIPSPTNSPSRTSRLIMLYTTIVALVSSLPS